MSNEDCKFIEGRSPLGTEMIEEIEAAIQATKKRQELEEAILQAESLKQEFLTDHDEILRKLAEKVPEKHCLILHKYKGEHWLIAHKYWSDHCSSEITIEQVKNVAEIEEQNRKELEALPF